MVPGQLSGGMIPTNNHSPSLMIPTGNGGGMGGMANGMVPVPNNMMPVPGMVPVKNEYMGNGPGACWTNRMTTCWVACCCMR